MRIFSRPASAHYGSLPQTYSNPEDVHRKIGYPGDDGIIDVLDISRLPASVGEVRKVKVLGVYCITDQLKTNWKVLTINLEDPIAKDIEGNQFEK